MTNKIFIGVLFGLICVAALYFLVFSQRKTATKSPIISKTTSLSPPSNTEKTIPSASLLTYSDPSGFTFSYPKELKVTPLSINDNAVYADLEITSSQTQGKITLTAALTQKNINALVKGKTNIKNIKLADLDAKQYEENGKIITVAIDSGNILFTITADAAQKEQWRPAYNTLIATFAFIPPEEQNAPPSSSDSDDGGVVFEGEETIQ